MAARGSQGSVPYLLRREACRGQSWVPVRLLGPKRGGVCEMTQGVSPLPQVPPSGVALPSPSSAECLGFLCRSHCSPHTGPGALDRSRAFRWPMGVQGL